MQICCDKTTTTQASANFEKYFIEEIQQGLTINTQSVSGTRVIIDLYWPLFVF